MLRMSSVQEISFRQKIWNIIAPQTFRNESASQVTITRFGRVFKSPERYAPLRNAYFGQLKSKRRHITCKCHGIIVEILCEMYLNTWIQEDNKEPVHSYLWYLWSFKNCGQKIKDEAYSEVKQIHDRVVFQPISVSKMLSQEKEKAIDTIVMVMLRQEHAPLWALIENILIVMTPQVQQPWLNLF